MRCTTHTYMLLGVMFACGGVLQLESELFFVDEWLTKHVSDHSALNHRKNIASALAASSSGKLDSTCSSLSLMLDRGPWSNLPFLGLNSPTSVPRGDESHGPSTISVVRRLAPPKPQLANTNRTRNPKPYALPRINVKIPHMFARLS